MTVYGPYHRKDGRQHVIHYIDGVRRTQSYPRFLMEEELNRKLEKTEHVDHIDEDHTNDDVENFQLLSQKENNKKSFIETGRSAKQYTFICPECLQQTQKSEGQVKHNRKQGKNGPYCSKSCAGKASHKK